MTKNHSKLLSLLIILILYCLTYTHATSFMQIANMTASQTQQAITWVESLNSRGKVIIDIDLPPLPTIESTPYITSITIVAFEMREANVLISKRLDEFVRGQNNTITIDHDNVMRTFHFYALIEYSIAGTVGVDYPDAQWSMYITIPSYPNPQTKLIIDLKPQWYTSIGEFPSMGISLVEKNQIQNIDKNDKNYNNEKDENNVQIHNKDDEIHNNNKLPTLQFTLNQRNVIPSQIPTTLRGSSVSTRANMTPGVKYEEISFFSLWGQNIPNFHYMYKTKQEKIKRIAIYIHGPGWLHSIRHSNPYNVKNDNNIGGNDYDFSYENSPCHLNNHKTDALYTDQLTFDPVITQNPWTNDKILDLDIMGTELLQLNCLDAVFLTYKSLQNDPIIAKLPIFITVKAYGGIMRNETLTEYGVINYKVEMIDGLYQSTIEHDSINQPDQIHTSPITHSTSSDLMKSSILINKHNSPTLKVKQQEEMAKNNNNLDRSVPYLFNLTSYYSPAYSPFSEIGALSIQFDLIFPTDSYQIDQYNPNVNGDKKSIYANDTIKLVWRTHKSMNNNNNNQSVMANNNDMVKPDQMNKQSNPIHSFTKSTTSTITLTPTPLYHNQNNTETEEDQPSQNWIKNNIIYSNFTFHNVENNSFTTESLPLSLPIGSIFQSFDHNDYKLYQRTGEVNLRGLIVVYDDINYDWPKKLDQGFIPQIELHYTRTTGANNDDKKTIVYNIPLIPDGLLVEANKVETVDQQFQHIENTTDVENNQVENKFPDKNHTQRQIYPNSSQPILSSTMSAPIKPISKFDVYVHSNEYPYISIVNPSLHPIHRIDIKLYSGHLLTTKMHKVSKMYPHLYEIVGNITGKNSTSIQKLCHVTCRYDETTSKEQKCEFLTTPTIVYNHFTNIITIDNLTTQYPTVNDNTIDQTNPRPIYIFRCNSKSTQYTPWYNIIPSTSPPSFIQSEPSSSSSFSLSSLLESIPLLQSIVLDKEQQQQQEQQLQSLSRHVQLEVSAFHTYLEPQKLPFNTTAFHNIMFFTPVISTKPSKLPLIQSLSTLPPSFLGKSPTLKPFGHDDGMGPENDIYIHDDGDSDDEGGSIIDWSIHHAIIIVVVIIIIIAVISAYLWRRKYKRGPFIDSVGSVNNNMSTTSNKRYVGQKERTEMKDLFDGDSSNSRPDYIALQTDHDDDDDNTYKNVVDPNYTFDGEVFTVDSHDSNASFKSQHQDLLIQRTSNIHTHKNKKHK